MNRARGLLVGIATLAVSALPATAGEDLVDLSPAEWKQALTVRNLDPGLHENPAAYSSEMQHAAQLAAASAAGPLERLRSIQDYLFAEDSAFEYDYVGTLTAREAFATRQGNCVAFTNLFIAMARSIGIPVQAALVSPRGEPETDGDLAFVRNHIVAMYRHAQGVTVYDFFTSRTGAPVAIKPIDDLWNMAIYENNHGVAALKRNDYDRALQHFDAAIRLAPRYAALYGNVGVAKRRMGDRTGAFDAYLLALILQPRNPGVRVNLQHVLEGAADDARARLEDFAVGTPSHELAELKVRAAERLVAANPKGALKLYRKAAARDPRSAQAQVAIARAQLLLGRPVAARRTLETALLLEPGDAPARRLLQAVEPIFQSKRRWRRKDGKGPKIAPQPAWGR